MRAFTADDNRVAFRSLVLSALAGAMGVGAMLASTTIDAPAQGKIPELGSSTFAWLAAGAEWRAPPAGMRGPILDDPDHPRHFNLDGPGQVTQRLGNYKDPVLKPWAAAKIRESNEEVLTGKRDLPFTAQSRCYPGGVPGQLLYPAEPMYFIQKPQQVWMVWQRDQMVRRIYLTDKHSEKVKPSRFGESIGRYENGDTLVIDTIGQNDKSFIDAYRTPHTSQIHTVERWKLAADGRAIEVSVSVEDPGAFTMPWTAIQRWRLDEVAPILQVPCNENNDDHFSQGLVPLAHADKPDF